MSIIGSNILAGASGQGGYNINNSLRFRSSASAYLNRTPGTAGNRQIFTWSGWVKRGLLTGSQTIFGASNSGTTQFADITIDGNGAIEVDILDSNITRSIRASNAVLRDPSAWYHLVVAVDTTQATAANRITVYLNGQTLTTTAVVGTFPAQNANTQINATTGVHNIGRRQGSLDRYFDGYLAEVNFIDGQALTPSSFGETDTTTGSWIPKKYTGTYGTNGFYLNFSDIATTSGSNAGLGKDFSGNANYWTTNNISVTAGITYDAMIDSPTLTSATVANYCVLNPLQRTPGGTGPTSANLKWAIGVADWYSCFASMAISSGKYYWEITNSNLTSSSTYTTIGITNSTAPLGVGNNAGSDANSWVYYSQNGNKINNGSQVAYGAAYVSNDIVGVAYDADNGKLYFSKNGTFQASGDPAAGTNAAYTGLSGTFFPVISELNSTIDINFGQRPFAYTPPSGYVRLNTFNLPDSTIVQGNKVMDATTYTGTGASLSVTNAGAFKPDFVWVKDRAQAQAHLLFDSVRGVHNFLISNNTSAESTNSTTLTSFNTNGFGLGTNVTSNQSGISFVGWQWQAGQGTTSSNTSGTITSTVSVNTTAGFSIVTYTGTGANATVGHGLGVAPSWVIVKSRSGGGSNYTWGVYHAATGATKYFELNTTAAVAIASTPWNNTAPTSSVFNIGTWTSVNTNTQTYVAYCWAEISGFSKFGSYTGNGSADGPFVYTGFRPKFIICKKTSDTSDWIINDTSRDTFNVTSKRLFTNTSDVESGTYDSYDILSNGFKMRNTNSLNISSASYIFMAFAESPFKTSLAR